MNFVAQLEAITYDELQASLDTDEQKKAFWVNIYNAFFQLLRTEWHLTPPEVFRKRVIRIAGRAFSLDDIEHGILRRYRLKWGLGYLSNPFVREILKNLAVKKMDFRIHFALNCGARSCPPIAFYTSDKINQQLDLATQSFLEAETSVFSEKKEIHITRLFQWYIGDFGGRAGIRRLLEDKLQLKTKGFRLVYKNYDWTEALENFSNAPN